MTSLVTEEVAQCAGQLAAAHGWAAAELLWQPPAPVWLLPALLLQLSRHGVFSRRGMGGGGGGGGAVLGETGTIQLASPEEAVQARPLLLLLPRAVSPVRLVRLAARLHGAELLQPDSGQLLRVARHADSGPLVTTIGHCRDGRLTPLPAPAPPGLRDLQVINKTYRVARLQDMKLTPMEGLAEDIITLLQDVMQFHITETSVPDLRAFFQLLRNDSVTLGFSIVGWSPERHPWARLTMPLTHYERGMFIRTPEPTSSPSFSGSLESDRLKVLAVCLLLLTTGGGYVTFRLSGAVNTRFSTLWLETFGVFCSQGMTTKLETISQHVATAVALGASFLSFQFYTADLLAQVTMEQAHLPFEELEDVTRLPCWSWAVQEGSVVADLMRYHPRPGANFTGDLAALTNSLNIAEWVARTAAEKFAFFTIPPLVLGLCTPIVCPEVCLHPQRFMRGWGGLPFRRGLAEWRAFDATLLRLKETGLLSRLHELHMPERLLTSLEHCDLEERPRTHWTPIYLSECRPVFDVLLGGVGAALLVLVLELIASRMKGA